MSNPTRIPAGGNWPALPPRLRRAAYTHGWTPTSPTPSSVELHRQANRIIVNTAPGGRPRFVSAYAPDTSSSWQTQAALEDHLGRPPEKAHHS